MVVTVSNDSEMGHETLSSLLFGKSCSSVRNSVKRKKVVDLVAEKERIKREIEMSELELKRMQADGQVIIPFEILAIHYLDYNSYSIYWNYKCLPNYSMDF